MSRKESFPWCTFNGKVRSVRPEVNGDIFQPVKWLGGGGGQPLQHIRLVQCGDRLEADGQDGSLALQVPTQAPERCLPVSSGAAALQKLIALGIAPSTVIETAAGGEQGGNVPVRR